MGAALRDIRVLDLTNVLAGPYCAYQLALMGADVVTLPPKILTALYHHPLTDSGLDAFLKDWKATGQSIL